MKQTVLALLAIIFPIHVFAITVSPNTSSDVCNIVVTSVDSTTGHNWYIWEGDDGLHGSSDASTVPNDLCSAFQTGGNEMDSLPDGTYNIVEVNFVGGTGQSQCAYDTGTSFATCMAQTSYLGHDTFTIGAPVVSTTSDTEFIGTASLFFIIMMFLFKFSFWLILFWVVVRLLKWPIMWLWDSCKGLIHRKI